MRFQLLSAGGSSSRFHSRYPTSGENYSCSSLAGAFDCITPQFSTDDFGSRTGARLSRTKKKNRRRFVSTEKARTDPPCNRPLNRPGQDRALPSPSPSKIRSYESISMILIPMDRPEDSREGARDIVVSAMEKYRTSLWKDSFPLPKNFSGWKRAKLDDFLLFPGIGGSENEIIGGWKNQGGTVLAYLY